MSHMHPHVPTCSTRQHVDSVHPAPKQRTYALMHLQFIGVYRPKQHTIILATSYDAAAHLLCTNKTYAPAA